MVAGSFSDVIVCVENTAQGGININNIKNDYILPALEQFSGGPPSDVNFSFVEKSSTYTLIPFKASDSLPAPASRIQGPFTSTKQFLTAFERLDFSGGGGETHSSGQEAVASALKVFDDLKSRRDADFHPARHIIYVSNSPMYDMPVLQCTPFALKSIDDLCLELKERQTLFSVFAPRKIPFLFKLFEKTGGDLAKAKEKNYAKDLRHMILLRGFVLEERPVTPKPPPSTSPNLKGYQFNPNMQQGMGNQQFMNQNQGGNVTQGIGNQGILKNALSMDNNQSNQPQENNTTLKGLLGKKPNPINQGPGWNFQVRGPMPGTNMQNQMQPGMNQRFPTSQQQGMGGMVHQGGMNAMQISQAGPMGVVMGNQQGMAGNPGGMAGQTVMGGGQNQGGMSVAQGGMTNVQGGMSVGQGPQGVMGAGPQGGMQPNMAGLQGGMMAGQAGGMQGQRAPQHREREIIWKGELEWQEKVKDKDGPADQKIGHSVACTVSTSKDNGQAEVRPDNWPSKLIMQLIPKTLVQTIGGQYFRHSKSVLFHPQECESLEALTKVMGSGFAGCVHFSGVCDIKVLILLYSSEKKAYLGFIPNDQASFVDRIRTVIQQQKAGQMRAGMQQQQQQQPMMNQQPGNMQMQGNILPQQVQPNQGMINSGMMPMTSNAAMMNNQAGGGGGGGQQMVMMPGGNMVRMQGQYMRMQGGGQRMMQQQNPGLRQILQQPGNMMGGGGMQGQQVMQNPGMQNNMQGGQGMQVQGMQGGMMMQQRMGQAGMMQQQQQQQQQPDPLRDLLN